MAHTFGLVKCMNHSLLASPSLSSGADPGVFEECRCWWSWRGDCAKCSSPVTEMDGIFCANFCKSRGGWPPCQMTWHAKRYECLGVGLFPLHLHKDVEGNPWFKQKLKEDEINQGVKGAHASIPFQCERCWLLNLEGHLPASKSDDMYIKLIRRANLDAFGGRAVTTTSAHASATKRLVGKCAIFGKMPMIPPSGPFPLSDTVGMSTAIDMLFHSITAKSCLAGEMHIQYNLMCKIRLTYMRS